MIYTLLNYRNYHNIPHDWQIKQHLRLATTDHFELHYIRMLCNSAIKSIENNYDVIINQQTWKLEAFYDQPLVLAKTPVLKINKALDSSDNTIAPSSYTLENDLFTINNYSGAMTLEFVSGYLNKNHVPPEIITAVFKIVAHNYENRAGDVNSSNISDIAPELNSLKRYSLSI